MRTLLVSLVVSFLMTITFRLAAAEAPKPAEKGPPAAEVVWGGKWYPAHVLAEKDGKFQIKYDNYGDEWNEWVGKDRIRFAAKPKGETKCEVESGGEWYPAQVIGEGDGQWKIKYDSFGDEWNERVGKDRIRLPGKGKTPAQTKTEVLWGGAWNPAQVLEEKDGKFLIHYSGYGDNWNEWVGKDRIRFTKINDEQKPADNDPPAKQQDEKQPNGQN